MDTYWLTPRAAELLGCVPRASKIEVDSKGFACLVLDGIRVVRAESLDSLLAYLRLTQDDIARSS